MALVSTRPFVLAVCGPAGAGKSTLLRTLHRQRPTVTLLEFDDYEAVSTIPDTRQWLASGADPNAYQTPQLIADLQALVAGQPIRLPKQSEMRYPAPLIVIEEPFGRTRTSIASLLDAAIYLETPFDVALARAVLRPNPYFPWERDAVQHIQQLHVFLNWYIEVGCHLARAIAAQVRPHCDLILDGTHSAEALAGQVLAWLPQE
jgi:uridine kinase